MSSVSEMLLTFMMDSWRLGPRKAKGGRSLTSKSPDTLIPLLTDRQPGLPCHTCRGFPGWWSCTQKLRNCWPQAYRPPRSSGKHCKGRQGQWWGGWRISSLRDRAYPQTLAGIRVPPALLTGARDCQGPIKSDPTHITSTEPHPHPTHH